MNELLSFAVYRGFCIRILRTDTCIEARVTRRRRRRVLFYEIFWDAGSAVAWARKKIDLHIGNSRP